MTPALNFFSELICWRQTFFSLSWLLCAVLVVGLSNGSLSISTLKWIEIFLAFFMARTSAMTFNRYFDFEFDGQNPRTKDRVLPAKKVALEHALWVAGISLLFYFLAAFSINTRCLIWALCSAPVMVGYSFFKRFSWTCHLVLGLAQSFLPIMVGIALQNKITPQQILLGLALAFNVAAFDVVYSLQDREFDQSFGLYSIPAAFGVKAALIWSRSLHSACIITLFYLGLSLQLPWLFFTGCALLGIGLTIGHLLMLRSDQRLLQFFICGNTLAGFIVLIALLSSYFWEILY